MGTHLFSRKEVSPFSTRKGVKGEFVERKGGECKKKKEKEEKEEKEKGNGKESLIKQ